MVRPSDENDTEGDRGIAWTRRLPRRRATAAPRFVRSRARERERICSPPSPPPEGGRHRPPDDGDFATWVWGGGSRRVARAPDRPSRERNRDEETIIVLTTATTFLSFHSPLSANHHRDVLEQRR